MSKWEGKAQTRKMRSRSALLRGSGVNWLLDLEGPRIEPVGDLEETWELHFGPFYCAVSGPTYAGPHQPSFWQWTVMKKGVREGGYGYGGMGSTKKRQQAMARCEQYMEDTLSELERLSLVAWSSHG